MLLQVNVHRTWCPDCERSFYELEEAVLDACPFCGCAEDLEDQDDSQPRHYNIELNVDHRTGLLKDVKIEKGWV